jgi:hypothetical protein
MARDGSRDFDFLFGSWKVRSRRLVERLKEGTDWEQVPGTCRWEQAYSTDGGRSWETNWIMEFTRQA